MDLLDTSDQSPVIIVGMHRSGTTLVSKCIEDLGIFLGWRKDINNESKFFIKTNNAIINESGSTWNNPIQCMLGNKEEEVLVSFIRNRLQSILRYEYWGLKKLKESNVPYWGWKDPRNTLTLRLWLKIFPKAKIVVVRRNAIDIAFSLNKRAMESGESVIKNNSPFGLFSDLTNPQICMATNLLNLDNCINICRAYEKSLLHSLNELSGSDINLMEINYEDFLLEPDKYIGRLERFLGRESDKKSVQIRTERRFAFKSDEKKRKYLTTISDLDSDGYFKFFK